MSDIESTLCAMSIDTSSSVDTPDFTNFTNLPCDLVRRSNSLRSRPSISTRPLSPMASPVCTPVSPTNTGPPQVVVLCLWPYATDAQIAFYVEGYATLYPSSQVLPLRSSWSAESPDREDVLDKLTKFQEKPSLVSENVLLHLFGHTGAYNACVLLRAYRIRTDEPLNVKAIISDTEPTTSLASLLAAIKSPSQMMLCLYIAIMVLWSMLVSVINLGDYDAITSSIREALTDPLLLPPDARKCFVIAQRNLMFSWREASTEGEQADRVDYVVKRTRVDTKGRWTGDQERYWMGIEGVWEGN